MTRGITVRAVLLLAVLGALTASILASLAAWPQQATVGWSLLSGLAVFVALAYVAGMGLLRGLDRLRRHRR